MMYCHEIENDLPLVLDGTLDPSVMAVVEDHLSACPLCRLKLSEYREMRADLRGLRADVMPIGLVEAIRASVAVQLAGTPAYPTFVLLDTPRSWFRTWLMPSSIATAASVVMAFALFAFIISPAQLDSVRVEPQSERNHPPVFVAGGRPSAVQFAVERRDVSSESPSVNPEGSLMELTASLVAGDIEHDEVVVVADVYENGSARIAEVVEPPRDRRATEVIEKAFEADLAYAPFVPAYIDNRPETMRVVLRLQAVNVAIR